MSGINNRKWDLFELGHVEANSNGKTATPMEQLAIIGNIDEICLALDGRK